MNVKFIGTHVNPHFDEIVAIWLLQNFGDDKLSGAREAEIIFYSQENPIPKGNPEDLERAGIVLIGIGGGRFDEHPTLEGGRKEGECAATLVAKLLGISEAPELDKILRFTAANDLRMGNDPFGLPYMVKLMHAMEQKPEEVMVWVFRALDAKYAEQSRFWGETKRAYEELAQKDLIPGPRGNKILLVTIVSDDPNLNKFARSEHGGRAAVVIQKNSSGNTQIITNKAAGIRMQDVAAMVRVEEQELKGRVVTTDFKVLAAEGQASGAEEWFFHLEGQMLLNGSTTAQNVPPTKISLERLREIVAIGVDPKRFDPERRLDCERSVCTSTQREPCPLYRYGLARCRTVRFNMHVAKIS